MTTTPNETTTAIASTVPSPGGDIISEQGGAIISETRGGFVGIGSLSPKLVKVRDLARHVTRLNSEWLPRVELPPEIAAAIDQFQPALKLSRQVSVRKIRSRRERYFPSQRQPAA